MLDMRTVFWGFMISNAICTLMIFYLWRANRKPSVAMNFWLAGYVSNFLSVILIVLRGVIPDFFSHPPGKCVDCLRHSAFVHRHGTLRRHHRQTVS